MRGRLIHRFVCVLRQLDTAATAAVPDGGYDDEFGEAIPVADGTQLGSDTRREKAAVRLMCQVDRQDWGRDRITKGGHDPSDGIILVLHRPELEKLSMVGADGKPTIYPGDRIEKIEDRKGNVQEAFDNMLVDKVEPAGYGLKAFGSPKFNLWNLWCSEPDLAGAS